MLEVKSKATSKSKAALLDLVFVALFAAVMTVCAQIQIPFGEVPFTLQTLGVFIAASLLGWKRGTLSVIVYVLLGLAGVPVFAGFSGGIGVLFGPTGGYIIGFIFTALIVGLMTEKLGKKLWVEIVSMILGLAVCYAFGTVWFMFQMKMGLVESLLLCVVPYLIADALKIAFSAVLVNRLDKVIKLLICDRTTAFAYNFFVGKRLQQ